MDLVPLLEFGPSANVDLSATTKGSFDFLLLSDVDRKLDCNGSNQPVAKITGSWG